MPIPATIADLSTTAASNSPSGSDSPTEGDNYLRALSAIVAQEHADRQETRFKSLAEYGGVCDGVTDDSTAYDNLRVALEADGETTCIINGDSLVHGHRLAAGLHTVLIQEFATIGTDNKIGNPNFASSATGWTLGSAWAFASTPDRIVHTTGTSSSATYPSVAIEKGEIYQLQVTITTTTSGVVNFAVGTDNVFTTEKRFFNAAKNALLDGDWFSTVAVAPLGTETSPGVGLEQLKEISDTTWYYTLVPSANSGSYTFTITADDRWGGSISDVRLIKVASPLKASSTISTDADPNVRWQYGMKVSQANFGVIGIGNQETLALVNGFATEADTGALNVAIGERAMRSLFDGIENVAVGASSMQFCEGSGNTAVGYSALKFSVKGMENTCIGYKALPNSTIGIANTTAGFHSMFYASTSSGCTALGHRALKWGFDGNYNTCVGYSAGTNTGGSNNTVVGVEAGAHIDATSAVLYTYSGAVAVGHQARPYGERSIAIGYQSRVGEFDSGSGTTHNYTGTISIGDASKAVGNSSIAIGDAAVVGSTSGASASAYANAIAIGAGTASTGSAAISMGVSAAASATESIAIGSSSFAAGTNDTSVGRGTGFNVTGGSNSSFGNGAGTVGSSQSYTNCTSLGNGAVPTGSNQVTLGNSSVATLRCQQTTITALSDARFKTDIEALNIPDEFLDAVQIVTYRWIAEGMPQGKQMGVIAQQLDEVQTVFGLEWLGLVDKSNPDRWEATPGKLLFPLIVRAQKQERRLRAIEELMGIV